MYEILDQKAEENERKNICVADNHVLFKNWIKHQSDWIGNDKIEIKGEIIVKWEGRWVSFSYIHGKYPGTCTIVDATTISSQFKRDMIEARSMLLEYQETGKIIYEQADA